MIVVTKPARHRIFRPIGIVIFVGMVIAIVMTVRRVAFELGAWEKGWSFRSGASQSPVHRASEEASPPSASGIAIQAPGGSGSFALFQQTLASVQAQLAKVSSPTTLGKNSTLTITDSGILKPTDHNQTQGGIGTDVSRIGKIWGTFMDLNDDVSVNGKLDLSGKLTANGGVQIGDSGADELQINSSLISSIVPKTTNSIDLGSTTYRFRTGYFTTSLIIGSGTTTITGTDVTTTNITTTNFTTTNLTVASLNSTSAADVDIRASGDNDITIRAGDGASNSTADNNDIFVSAEDSGIMRFGDFSLTVSEDATYPLTLRSSSGGIQLSTGSTDNGNLTLYSAGTLTLDSSANNTTILLQAGTGGINLSAGTARLTGNLIVTGTTALNGITYTWPGADGSSGQALTTNASGVLSWSAVSSSFTDSGTSIYPTNSARKFIYGYEGQLTGSGYFNTIGNDAIVLRAGQAALDTSTSGATSTTADIQLAAADALLATAGTLNLLASNDSTYPLILRSSQGGIQLSTQSSDNGNLTLYSSGTLTLDTSRNNTNILFLPGTGNVGIGTTSPGQLLDLAYGHLRFTTVTAPGAPSTALAGAGAGNVDNGDHDYAVTFVTASGETELGTYSTTVTVSDKTTNGIVSVTNIPTGPTGVTARKIYRSRVSDYGFVLITTINDNTTTTYTDNTADNGSAVDNINRGNTTSGAIYVGTTRAGYVGIANPSYQTAFGGNALNSTETGYYNSAFGWNTLHANTTGYGNTAMGMGALQLNTNGYGNTAVGVGALQNLTGGINNVAVGGGGNQNLTGTGNVFLGYSAGYFETGSNKLFIDNAVRNSESDGRAKALIYGIFDAAVANQYVTINGQLQVTGTGSSYLTGNVGVGNTVPKATLDAVGNNGVILRAGQSAITLSSSTTSTTADIELAAADQMDLFAGRFSLTTSSGTAGDVKIDSAGTLTLSTSRNNTNIILSPGTGNVGIGTAAPAGILDVIGNAPIILRAGQAALGNSTSGATSTTADIQLAAADALLATAGTLNLLASNDSTYPLILRSSQGGIQLSTQSSDNGNLTLYSSGTLTLDTSRNNTNISLLPGSGAVSLTSTATTSDVLTLTASSLTSGSGLVLTGPSGATAGMTDSLLKITGDAGATGTTNGLVSSTATIDDGTSGSAVNLYLSTTNSPSAYNAAYGIYSTLTDATALDNSTLYGEYQKVTLTNNAYKEGTGIYVELSSASTVGDLLNGGYFDARSTGAISTGSKSITGIYGSVSNSGPDTGGTSTVYGGYFGVTSNTGGTSTAYGAYASAAVADTLYALYATLPIGVGAGSTGYAIYADAGTGAGTEYSGVFLNGNLGIGTAAPAGMLDVKGTASGVLLRAGASSLQLSSSATSTTADIELAAADQIDLFAGRFSLTTSSGTAGDVKIDSAGTLTLSTSRNNTNINILTGSGKIGINMTAAPSYTLDVSGTGRFSCANDFANVSHSTFCSDVAETYETNDPTLEPGDVLAIDPSTDSGQAPSTSSGQAPSTSSGKVAKSQEEYDPKTVGVYSTSPGLLVGGETILGGTSTTSITGTTSSTNNEKKVPVALVGRVPVKIAGSSQPIAVGDFLTASGEPGKAMKATRAGYTIGKALESWQPRATSHEPRATIEVFVNLGYFMGTMTADGFIDTSSVATASPSAATDQISDSALSTSQSESNFESLQTRIAQLEELVYTMTGSSDKLQGTSDKLPEASDSASPFASQDVSNDLTLSGDLTVLGSTNLADTTIGGKLIVGVIAVDDIGGSIDALGTALKIQPSGLADVEFMGGKIIVTKAGDLEIKTGMIAGNSSFRDAVVMPAPPAGGPAGQGSLRIDTSWKTAPTTVTVTPTWNTTVWVEDLSSSGFTIHVGASPSAPAKLFWLAIW